MSEAARERYFEMLAQKISAVYGVAIDTARNAVSRSAIQDMVRECPEYVGHVSIYDWAEEVYEEMCLQ